MKFLQKISKFFKRIFSKKPKVVEPTEIKPAEPVKIDLANRKVPQKNRDRFLKAVAKGSEYLAELSGSKIYLGKKSIKPGNHSIRYIQMPIFDVTAYDKVVQAEEKTEEINQACKNLHNTLMDYKEGYFYDEFDRDFQVINICNLWNELAQIANLPMVNVPQVQWENY